MKVILIINMPEDFNYRRCSIGGDGNIYYERDGEQRVSIIGNIKNLKSIPQKKEVDYSKCLNYQDGFYAEGWNECLDEILGNNKEEK